VVATNLHPGGRCPTSLKAIHHQIERDHTDLDISASRHGCPPQPSVHEPQQPVPARRAGRL
jgi:hypothetical protein